MFKEELHRPQAGTLTRDGCLAGSSNGFRNGKVRDYEDERPIPLGRASKSYKFIYGPVHSWRLGVSLGIDPLSRNQKICNMNCVYCQLGKTAAFSDIRKEYVSVAEIVSEINSLPVFPFSVDHLTFSGRGEPTLAKNLGDLIRAVRIVRHEKIAVITNSSLLYLTEVQQDLMGADYVLAKLDACSQETFERVDKPSALTHFQRVLDGILSFRSQYKGRLALQIMFIDRNRERAREIAEITRKINPDEIFLNTPLRPSAVRPLSQEDLFSLKNYFIPSAEQKGTPIFTAYEAGQHDISPMNEQDTSRRRTSAGQTASEHRSR